MFFSFVDELRAAGIPASMKEHPTLLEAIDAGIIGASPEESYYLARATAEQEAERFVRELTALSA